MRVVYSDESGTGSEQKEPITVVAGLMLNIDSQWHPVLELIESALFDYTGEKNPSYYEIRGRDLYNRIKNGDKKADKFMAALVSIPMQCPAPVFYGAIHRKGFNEVFARVKRNMNDGGSDLPEGAMATFQHALVVCMVEVETYVHTFCPEEQVLWIHDKGRYDEDAKGNLKNLRRLIDEGPLERKEGVFRKAPYPAKSHIADTIYFGKSQESRAIQLADVCCTTIARHLRGDQIATPYYALLRQKIINPDRRPEYE